MRNSIKLLLICSLLVLDSVSLNAQPIGTGSSLGLAGSNGMAMHGVRAANWNPANLGMKENPLISLYLPLSFGVSLGNNSFTPKYITETFVKGDTLFAEDKNEIIDKLDADDFKTHITLGIPILAFSFKEYAFNLDGYIFLKTTLPSEVFEMALTGPVEGETYNFDNIESEAITYSSTSFSFAKAFKPLPYLRQLSAGLTIKYIRGFGFSSLIEHTGQIQITHKEITLEGDFKNLTSLKGDGMGFDIGGAVEIEPLDMYCGLTLGNIVGNINWTETEINEGSFYIGEDGINIDSLTSDNYWQELFNDSDSTYDGSDFISPLPRYMLLSFKRSFFEENIITFLSYYQGLNNSSAHSTVPKVSTGAELNYSTLFPLRFGLSLGGKEGTELSCGFGINARVWQFDYGMSWQRGLFLGAKGISISLTNYFSLSPKQW